MRGVGAAAERTPPGPPPAAGSRARKGPREAGRSCCPPPGLAQGGSGGCSGVALGVAPWQGRQRVPAARRRPGRGELWGSRDDPRGGRLLPARPAAAGQSVLTRAHGGLSSREGRNLPHPLGRGSPGRILGTQPSLPPAFTHTGDGGWVEDRTEGSSVLPTLALETLRSWENKCQYALWHPATCGDGIRERAPAIYAAWFTRN